MWQQGRYVWNTVQCVNKTNLKLENAIPAENAVSAVVKSEVKNMF